MFLKPLKLLFLLTLLFYLASCSEEKSPIEPVGPEEPEEAVDTYQYIALRNDGTLFSVGDNSGKVAQMGKIPGTNFNIIFNAITSSGSKTYIYEHYFDPPRGILYVWDRNSGETESTILNFPEAEVGEFAGLLSLDWDKTNQNLVGITRQEMEQGNYGRPMKIVRINPENFEVEAQDIDLGAEGYDFVFSTQLIGQNLYATASKSNNLLGSDLLEINLNQKSFRELSLPDSNPIVTNLGYGSINTQLFGFSPVANSSLMGEVRPVIYRTGTESLADVTEFPRISNLGIAHKTFYNKDAGEFAELVGANNKLRLLKFNTSEGTHELVELLNSEDLSTLIAIVGVKKI